MKTHISLSFILAFALSALSAQNTAYELVPYKFGKFEAELPSGKKFYITGSLINMDKPPADVVVLNIYKLNRKNSIPEECPYYSGYFWKNKDDISTEFKIFIDRPLLFSRSYKFEFQYFSSAQYTAGKNILSVFINKLDAHFEAYPSITELDLIELLKKVNEQLKEDNFGTLEFATNGSCNNISTFQFQKSIKQVTFPIKTANGDVTAAELAGIIADRYLVKSNLQEIATAKDALLQLANNPVASALLDTLQHLLRTQSGALGYNSDDLDVLKSVVRDKDFTKNPFPAFSKLYPGQLINTDQKVVLGSMSNAMKTIFDENSKLEKNKGKVAAAEAQLGTFEEIVLQGYSFSGTSISYNTIEFQEAVSTDAINATTPAGISGAFLNPSAKSGPTEFDAFGNAAVRSYFMPVDKRLPGKLAYVDWGWPLNRMSATLGVSVSAINYRGESLKPAVGIKPVFALGYDVSRNFSIDLGAVLFRQENTSLLTKSSAIKFAPVFSLQVDANLFNRIKTIGAGEKFNLGEQ